MGVDINFPDGAVLEGSDANSIAAASGYFYSLSELHSQYTELLQWAKEKHDKALEDKFNSRLALLQTNKPELIHRLHHNVQELDGF